MKFDKSLITVKSALKKVRDTTKSEWWFDREGVFHFGPPEPTKHALRFITDADAGKTTPPYQSVRVIGSGAASQEGYARSNMEIEDKIVKSGDIVIEKKGGETTYAIDDSVSGDSLKEPVFEYKNLEISNDKQAQNTLESLASDLGEQQAGGKITVVGFPEIIPHDGVQMPTANPEKEGEPNYNPRQPMGGYTYGVYKVTHFLNGQDGFTTEIEVAGLTGVTKSVVLTGFDQSAETDTSLSPDAVQGLN
jgi:hypothetical protein